MLCRYRTALFNINLNESVRKDLGSDWFYECMVLLMFIEFIFRKVASNLMLNELIQRLFFSYKHGENIWGKL